MPRRKKDRSGQPPWKVGTEVASQTPGTAEEIVQQYPTLPLAEVYSVLGYVLHHQSEVAAYLAGRAEARTAVREENERQFDSQGIRARLLARPRQTPQEG